MPEILFMQVGTRHQRLQPSAVLQSITLLAPPDAQPCILKTTLFSPRSDAGISLST
jgi:hypothetical protein